VRTFRKPLEYCDPKAQPNQTAARLIFDVLKTCFSAHVAGELFKLMAGADMVHVPYRGAAPAMTDLLGGQVQVVFTGVSNTVEYIKASRLRALAVTTTTRSEALPD
jgi:hypothetical protein